MDHILCIVSRQHPDLFAYLQHRFKDSMVTVILDRRLAARRRAQIGAADERRRQERRRRPDIDADLVHQSHAIVRPGESLA
jgi:hypothetical protein